MKYVQKHLTAGLSFAFGLIVSQLTSLNTATAEALVKTEQGVIRGLETPGMRVFLGVPYATPPVGDLRWMPPQTASSWSGVFSATEFGSHCAQTAHVVGTPSTSEDCLFLNVYVPDANNAHLTAADRPGSDTADSDGRPVMVWIHGGAFTAGESEDFDGSKLASTGGVILVTINYRLGVLGFLAHPALTAEAPRHVSGNYGVLDQQLALKWVQHNIRAFGGNPNNVTIVGQSAGGASVLANMASPSAAGLFHRAIVQSGAYDLVLPDIANAETRGAAFASAAGCDDQTAHCLRSLSVRKILASQTFVNPIVDGFVIPFSLQIAVATGQFNRVPVINGSNRDEARFMYAMNELAGQVVPAAEYPAAVIAAFGPQAGPLVLNRVGA